MVKATKKNGPDSHKHNSKACAISYCNELDPLTQIPIFVAIPVKCDNYELKLNQSSISPIHCDCANQIKQPNSERITNSLLNSSFQPRVRVSDFLNSNMEVGQLWQPLLNLLGNYITFCEQQASEYQVIGKSKFYVQIDWAKKKKQLIKIRDEWLNSMHQILSDKDIHFKETRTLIFKTTKLLVPLTENGLLNSLLMNKDQPLVIAWLGACMTLSSIGNYAHALCKYSNPPGPKNEYYKKNVNDFWKRFSQMVKIKKTQLSKDIKNALEDCKKELESLKKESNFLDVIKRYFSRTTKGKSLKIIKETERVINLGLKLLDFKRENVSFKFL